MGNGPKNKATKNEHKPAWGPILEREHVEPFMSDCAIAELSGKFADWLSVGGEKAVPKSGEIWDGFEEQYQAVGGVAARQQLRGKYRQKAAVVPAVTQKARYNYGKTRKPQSKYRQHFGGNQWFRKASVVIGENWRLLEEIQLAQLAKVWMSASPTASDLVVAGTTCAYDRAFDNIKPKSSRALKPSAAVFPKVCTVEDPIIRQNVAEAAIFGTDSVISTLMSAAKSVSGWDILVHRVSNLLFYDKRPDSDLDLQSVNETASDPQFDHNINSPTSLSLEASTVNQYYSQQCLLPQKKDYGPNPFFTDQNSLSKPSVGYKYRLFDFGHLKALIRCEFDAYSLVDNSCINIKSLLEWGTKSQMQNWRAEFENYSGSTLAGEIKNNSCKINKWTSSAIMAGDHQMKIGFISRNYFANNKDHSIIGSLTVNSRDLANQIGLSMNNAWGIIYSLSKKLLDLPEGKYIIFKDPLKVL